MPQSTSRLHNEVSGQDKEYLCSIISAVLSLEGLITFLLVFRIPSMGKNAFLFGFSPGRILTGASVLAMSVIFLAASIYFWKKAGSAEKFNKWILDNLIQNTRQFLRISLIFLGFPLVVYSGLAILYFTPVEPIWPPLIVVVNRALAAIIWFPAIFLHLWAYTAWLWSRNEKAESLKEAKATNYGVLLATVTMAAVQWWTLLLRSNWIREVGSWFRSYRFKSFEPTHALLLVIFLAAAIVVHWLINSTAGLKMKLLVVFVLGAVLLAGYGFAEGPGFDFFTNEYLISEFQLETRWACEYPGSLLDAVRNYEAHFGDTVWYGTKPPGLLVLYKMAKEVLGLFYPSVKTDTIVCLWGVTKALAYLAPFLTFLTLFPLASTAEQLLGKEKGYAAGLLYVCIPNVLLMVLKPDQFIYPFFFSLAVFSLALMLQKGKTWKACLLSGFFAGSMVYISIFVSFSLLPVLGLAAAWIGLAFLADRGWEEIKPWSWKIAGLILGFMVLWLLSAVFLKFNMIQRYQFAMANHVENKDFYFTLPTLLKYARLNNVEFAFWTGMPAYLLMVVGAVRSAAAVFRRKADGADLFGAAFLFTYLALQVIGQTRGEVGRMWIFLLPAGVILAAREASRLTREPGRGLMLVFTLQVVTTDLMFLFMNWR